MKPSERIKEIFGSNEMKLEEAGKVISAIIQYLNEEYEKHNHKGEELPNNIKRI